MIGRKKRALNVEGNEISLKRIGNDDYISLTDMLKSKDGVFFVKTWLRNRNSIEFLSIWESMNNPDFNWHEFELIRNQTGLNSIQTLSD